MIAPLNHTKQMECALYTKLLYLLNETRNEINPLACIASKRV